VPPRGALDVVVGEEELPERELTPEEQERLHIRKRIQKLAQEKPEEVAMIMRAAGWWRTRRVKHEELRD